MKLFNHSWNKLIVGFVETGTISVYFGAALGVLYSEFSQALTRYTHNLLARGLLLDTLQVSLLHHLGVSPVQLADNNNAWPLQVYPRTLAVLAQVTNSYCGSLS